MSRLVAALATSVVTFLAIVTLAGQQPAPSRAIATLRTRAELTNYEETSRYDDVRQYMIGLAASPLVHVDTFGRTEEGRGLPFMVISEPRVKSAEEARRLNRPIVFIQGNIHAGEVEGKEAVLMLARRLVDGDLKPLTRQLVIMMAPDYNADGNEHISPMNRSEQNGPVGGVGTRENSKGLDLNRDYMKAESAEARGLVSLLSTWDPHLVVDLHTTDGSYHGYHLTYSPMLNPNADPRLVAFERNRMLPALRTTLREKHHFDIYYYGNFSPENSARESSRVDPANPGDVTWRTFDHRPRFGNNYVGLRNRLTILSEAYSYLDFKGRVDATAAYVEEILHFTAANRGTIRDMTARADRDLASGPRPTLGVQFEFRAGDAPVEILVSDVTRLRSPRSGRDMLQRVATSTPVKMKEFGEFAATKSLPLPEGWILSPQAVAAKQLAPAIERLRLHGIKIEEFTKPTPARVERFTIDSMTQAERPFQGHREAKLTGRLTSAESTVAAGTLFISGRQPLARLAFYLLEPESDDGFVDWNIIEQGLAAGSTYPVERVVSPVAATSLRSTAR